MRSAQPLHSADRIDPDICSIRIDQWTKFRLLHRIPHWTPRWRRLLVGRPTRYGMSNWGAIDMALSWETKLEITEFLNREAHLLDNHRFEEWLDLFTDDIEYLVPLRELVQGDVEAAGHPIIKDDKTMLTVRVRKDDTGYSHVESPASMTCHMISNIVVEETERSDEVLAHSAFIIRQARKLRDESWWSGRRHDRIRKVGDRWQISSRHVDLDATILPRGVSIFF